MDLLIIVDRQAIDGPSLDRAVIFQSHALLPSRTVMGNVAYAVASKWRRFLLEAICDQKVVPVWKVVMEGAPIRQRPARPD